MHRAGPTPEQQKRDATERRRELPWWKKTVFAVLVFAPSLVALELIMRRSGLPPAPVPAPHEEAAPGPFEYFVICDQRLGFRNRTNGVYRCLGIQGNPLVTTDGYGYRNGFGWSGDRQSPIVLFIGDSFTFCAEVNDDETGPSEVAKLLGEESDVRVLNAGVLGYSVLQSKRMMQECFERFSQIKVVVYSYCGNDLAECMVPNYRFPAKAPVILRDASTDSFRVFEVTDPVVPWGESFVGWWARRPAPTTTARLAAWLRSHLALYRHCRIGWQALTLPFRRLPGGNQAIPDDELPLWEAWAREHGGSQVMRHLLSEMRAIAKARGAELVATHVMYNEENILEPTTFPEDCQAAGVPFYSLDAAFRPDARPYVARFRDGSYEGHFNARGTRAFAKILAPAVQRILQSVAEPCTDTAARFPPRSRAAAGRPPSVGHAKVATESQCIGPTGSETAGSGRLRSATRWPAGGCDRCGCGARG